MVSRSQSGSGRPKRGFAAMGPEERREISRRGGTASHASGRGHEFNSAEAREAGRRGGEARWGRGREEEEERGRRTTSRSRSSSSSRTEPEEERIVRSERRYTPYESKERGEYRSSRYEQSEEEGGVEYDPGQRPGRDIGPRGTESRWVRPEEEEEERGTPRLRRGAAAIDPEEQRDIPRRGGEASGRMRGGRIRRD